VDYDGDQPFTRIRQDKLTHMKTFGTDPRVPNIECTDNTAGIAAHIIDKPALERARFFAALGLTVIPLRARDKVPAIGWKRYQYSQPTDDDLIAGFDRATKDLNIGIVTGRVSGVVVVDTDNPEAETWVAAHLPATPMATHTARGVHRFYRYPAEGLSSRPKRLVGPTSAAIDIQGDGRYVVAPGSVHPSGFIYEAAGQWCSAADLPMFDERWFPDVIEQPRYPTRKIGSGKPPAVPVASAPLPRQGKDLVSLFLYLAPTLSSEINETRKTDDLPPSYRGTRARWRKELNRFLRLWGLRGTFHEGTRANAVMICAYLLSRNRCPDDEIIAAATFLARQCAPPLPDAEIGHRIDCGVRQLTTKLTRAAIDNWLGVQPEERAFLDPEEQARLDRLAYRQDRTEAIEKALMERPGWPLRRLSADLKAQGFSVSHPTLCRHRKARKRVSESLREVNLTIGDFGLRDAA
jgi:hypothetical protein